MKKKQKKNNRGIITIPFLLVLVIVLFFTLSFLMLAMTLSHVTVTQYMAYSSARKLSLAGLNKNTQLDTAIDHYQILRERFFKPTAYTGQTGDWFYIQEGLVDTEQQYSIQGDYPESTAQKRFYGVNTRFQALALNLKIPFIIENDNAQINEPVRISSFLGREPSQKECKDFHEKKAQKIQALCNNTDCPNITEPVISKGDNGC